MTDLKEDEWRKFDEIVEHLNAISPTAGSLELARLEAAGDLPPEVVRLLVLHMRIRMPEPLTEALASEQDTPPPLTPGTQLGSYELIERVGTGGMGVVYRARRVDGRFERDVAVKVIRALGDPAELRQRFSREQRILARLVHPSIARLYDAGTTGDGTPYLVMEFVRGQPIDVWCRERQLDVKDRLALFRRVCVAVIYAHRNLVIHRDLKPSNILVTEDGIPMLLDFGISKLLDSEIGNDVTVTRERRVTLQYGSPEQFTGEPLATSSDVYSLGLILYELLTDKPAYDLSGLTPSQIEARICTDMPPPPSSRIDRLNAVNGRSQANRIRGDLDTIILKSLEKSVADRYRSVEQLDDDLRRHIEGLPIEARPPSRRYRLIKFIRRNLIVVTGTVTLFISVLVGLVATFWQYYRAQAHQQEASARLSEVLQLAALHDLKALKADSSTLWPAWPDAIEPLTRCIGRANKLLDSLDGFRHSLAVLEGRMDPLRRPKAFELTDSERQWWIQALQELIGTVEELADPDPSKSILADLRGRLARAETVQARSIEAHRDEWLEAIAAIKLDPRCGELEFKEQMGLVPLGPDRKSGLWEFWDVESGDRPNRNSDTGEWVIGEQTGLVLMLVPGGSFFMGMPEPSEDRPGFPRESGRFSSTMGNETPVHRVNVAPFFLSKYEMTQGQWIRVVGTNPSAYQTADSGHDRRYPVENMSWVDAVVGLRRHGMRLPTEAQWEYSARAGSDTLWWTGDELLSLVGYENIADKSFGLVASGDRFEPGIDDGSALDSPVGSYKPNGFGLFDVAGNVTEWCESQYVDYPSLEQCGDWIGLPPDVRSPVARVMRGGNYGRVADMARSRRRLYTPPSGASFDVGLRPARSLQY